jgi:hypothetical protein
LHRVHLTSGWNQTHNLSGDRQWLQMKTLIKLHISATIAMLTNNCI